MNLMTKDSHTLHVVLDDLLVNSKLLRSSLGVL